MLSHDGRPGLILKREIYNYRELRDQLTSKGNLSALRLTPRSCLPLGGMGRGLSAASERHVCFRALG